MIKDHMNQSFKILQLQDQRIHLLLKSNLMMVNLTPILNIKLIPNRFYNQCSLEAYQQSKSYKVQIKWLS